MVSDVFLKNLTTSLGICVLSIALGLLAFGQSVNAEPDVLRISGSTTIRPISDQLAQAFMRRHPEYSVTVAGGGSSEGIDGLLKNKVHIANSSRFISEQELRRAVDEQVYPVPFRFADDCIIPIVHNSNRLKNLSRDQLKAIYNGQLTNWKQLGGADLDIAVVSRDASSGTFNVWHQIVMEGAAVAENLIEKGSSAAVVKAVSRQRGAIGYIGLGYLSANVRPLRVDGVMGSLRSVKKGTYQISRPLFMFTRGWPSGRTLEFVNFVLDPARGQKIVRDSGYIPLYYKTRR